MNKGFTRQLKTGCLFAATLTAAQICQAAFTLPTSGLTTQFDAAVGVDDTAGAVNTWTDQAAGGGAIVLNSTATKPTETTESFGSGSHTVIQFTGALNEFLSSSGSVAFDSLVDANQGALFMVFRQEASAAATPVGWGGGPNRLFAQTAWNTTELHFQYGNPGAGGGDYIANNSTVVDNTWHVLSLIRDGTTGMIRVDGNFLQQSATAFEAVNVVSGTGVLRVGGTGFNDDNFEGAIAEILTYDAGGASLANAQAVESYLGEKYGLTVVPEPSEYAMFFGLACIAGALVARRRKQALTA